MNTEQIESNPWENIISSAMKKVQIEFESVCFMHEQQEDYIDIYAEEPKW